jgi:hypothetical protein
MRLQLGIWTYYIRQGFVRRAHVKNRRSATVPVRNIMGILSKGDGLAAFSVYFHAATRTPVKNDAGSA